MGDEFKELPAFLEPKKRKSRGFWAAAAAAILLLAVIVFAVSPTPPRQQIIDSVHDIINDRVEDAIKSRINYTTDASLDTVTARNAYVTLLTHYSTKEVDPEHENFFIATRILTYQLVHAPATRSQAGYPLIVIVNQHITEEKRDRLRRDGAIIWEPEPVDWGWLGETREHLREDWRSVMVKLRLWGLTQFDRICFLDGDVVLNRNLDGIFDDPAVQIQTTGTDPEHIQSDESPLPDQFVFAGTPELTWEHFYPPTNPEHDYYELDYFNGGFFVTQPSQALLDYYLSLLQTPDRFDPGFPEQNLWNYAHRREGNMPWQYLNYEWNTHFPSLRDKQGGVATMHTHWWRPVHDDLQPYLAVVKASMEAYFGARDEIYEQLDFGQNTEGTG